MRTLISLLMVLSLSMVLSVCSSVLPGPHATAWASAGGAAPSAVHRVQARKKKKKARPAKAKPAAAAKKTDKPKKNDRGFEL